eukprot:gnl/Trimastix_PCT/4434.p1 GENE.gnl/Trimastix_PCT/4434~~gnl/Trimastix_PCT/4434.p1  ORF type:complete len:248 (+),score=58.92 gnl/Trimastix_PCT/4434:79-822(+)
MDDAAHGSIPIPIRSPKARRAFLAVGWIFMISMVLYFLVFAAMHCAGDPRHWGLPKGTGWFLPGIPQDNSDPQWQEWKKNYPILFGGLAAYVILHRIIKWIFPVRQSAESDPVLSSHPTALQLHFAVPKIPIVRVLLELGINLAFLFLLHGMYLLWFFIHTVLIYALTKPLARFFHRMRRRPAHMVLIWGVLLVAMFMTDSNYGYHFEMYASWLKLLAPTQAAADRLDYLGHWFEDRRGLIGWGGPT